MHILFLPPLQLCKDSSWDVPYPFLEIQLQQQVSWSTYSVNSKKHFIKKYLNLG